MQGERACMISAHSGPTMCTPTTLSLSAATSSFIIALAGFPEMVFFIGLRQWPHHCWGRFLYSKSKCRVCPRRAQAVTPSFVGQT